MNMRIHDTVIEILKSMYKFFSNCIGFGNLYFIAGA